MNWFSRVLCITFCGVCLSASFASAGLIYQDFEDGTGTNNNQGWGFNEATVSFTDEEVHSGEKAWKIESSFCAQGLTPPSCWGGTGIPSQVQEWDMDFEPQRHDRLRFWIKAEPDNETDNEVRVKFFDQDVYHSTGFEVSTSKAAKHGEWTELDILFSQLPNNFDLTSVDKIEFVNRYTGTYYIDDIQVVSADRVYQSFEPIIFWENFTGEEHEKYGWAWFGTVDLYVDDLMVYEGERSWQLNVLDYFGGTGIKSQEKKLVTEGEEATDCNFSSTCNLATFGGYYQSEWYVDLDGTSGPGAPEESPYDRITFWVYALPENGMDNDLGFQAFDYNHYPNEPVGNPYVIWPKKPAVFGQWTKFSVPLDSFPSDFELNNMNKLQFQQYWRGSYFYDDIRVSKSVPEIDEEALAGGDVEWNAISGAQLYTLEQSTGGAFGPWEELYHGANTSYSLNRVSPAWLRVRWEEAVDEDDNPIAYKSDWSDVVKYEPSPVLIDQSSLASGTVAWTNLPQADKYQVEKSSNKNGPWEQIHNGVHTTLTATNGKWYRVRALVEENSVVVDTSDWSPQRSYTPNAGYLKAVGKVIKEQDGNGDPIILSGVNLGNYLLIEAWMTGFTVDGTTVTDDWSIRTELTDRFGATQAKELLEAYQDSYLTEYDLDTIMRSGASLVRLPIYYRAVREINESTGEWAAGSSFDFSQIDRIVEMCEDRGIYVLLDLHGAPGHQSKEFHSGRISAESPSQGYYHQLFDPNNSTYRQRTKELWEAMADHYKNNTTVMGYDLLNEPFGAVDSYYYPDREDGLEALWSLYDQLYDAIRVIDNKHIIVMEAIPSDKDWDTLPDPDTYSWNNVVYQFHYYGFKFNAQGKIDGVLDADLQDDYLISGDDPDCDSVVSDELFCGKVEFSKQDEYDVPVLIGEFNGFNLREIWDLYAKTFNDLDWSWTVWSYKHHKPREQWGLQTHMNYDEETGPDVGTDSAAELEAKFAKYDTRFHHEPNVTLVNMLSDYYIQSRVVTQPATAGRTPNAVKKKWYNVVFDLCFKHKPVLIAGIETFNGEDTAGLRIKQVNRRGFTVKIEEERSQDPETNHTTEVVSYFAVEPGTITNSSGAAVGEAGEISAYQKKGSQWHTIQLKNTYTNPVVFMQIVTFHGRQASHIRLRNIGSNSFQFQIEEWDYLNQKHMIEKVDYVVLEEGTHALSSGLQVEVGKETVDDEWTNVSYGNSYSVPPATISQCQTYNESGAVVTRQKNVTTGSFDVKLQEEEGSDGQHANETVGYIAVDLD